MKTDLPKISVITPSFNQGEFLEQTILSVIDQKYPNLDYIIIDGGSTDHSIEIIKKYEKHLAYWVSEKDEGLSQAINKGISKAKGEIICWLSSDDVFNKSTLSTVSELFLLNPNVDVLYGNCYFINEAGHIIKKKRELSFTPRAIWCGFNIIPLPSSFYRKKIFDEIGLFDENLHFVMDFELNIRLILNNNNIKYFPVLLSFFRWHEKSKSTDITGSNSFSKEKTYLLYDKYNKVNPFNSKIKRKIAKLLYHYYRFKRLVLSLSITMRLAQKNEA